MQAASQLDLARAIGIAIDKGANIINISGGEFSNSGASETLLANAIKKCEEKGILIVAAAGNDGCECLHLPAAEPSVLAIGAMDENNEPSSFSNWGKAYKQNGLIFPGNNIHVASLENDAYTQKSGTSYATPIAAGVVALLLSYAKQHNLSLTPQDLFKTLLETATK